METIDLPEYVLENRATILSAIRRNSYVPQPVLGVTNLKGRREIRLLGIPIVADRWLQKALSQQLMIRFNWRQ